MLRPARYGGTVGWDDAIQGLARLGERGLEHYEREQGRKRKQKRRQTLTTAAAGVGLVGTVTAAAAVALARDEGQGDSRVGFRRISDQVLGFTDTEGAQAQAQYHDDLARERERLDSDRAWTIGCRWTAVLVVAAASVTAFFVMPALALGAGAAGATLLLLLGGRLPGPLQFREPPAVFPDAGRKSAARRILQGCVRRRTSLHELLGTVNERDPLLAEKLTDAQRSVERMIADTAYHYEVVRRDCRDLGQDPAADPGCVGALQELEESAAIYDQVWNAAVLASKGNRKHAVEALAALAGVEALTEPYPTMQGPMGVPSMVVAPAYRAVDAAQPPLAGESASAPASEAVFIRGCALDEAGDSAAARDLFMRAADAGHSAAMFKLGLIEEKSGDPVRSRVWWTRAANAGHTDAMTHLADLEESAGDLAAARFWFSRAVKTDPGNCTALNRLGDLQASAGDAASARAYYTRALAVDPRNHYSMLSLGVLDLESADAGGARFWFTRVLQVDPGNEAAKHNLKLLDD